MPSFSAHYIFAAELIAPLQNRTDFELNKDALYFGTQGPDIFLFHRVYPWLFGKSLRKISSKLHRTKPALILEAMRDYCKITQNNIVKSYVYGFIMHYALDCKCHPFVYSMQNKIVQSTFFSNPYTIHNKIEFSIDSYLLNKRLKIAHPEQFKTEDILNVDNKITKEIAKLYKYLIHRLYEKDVAEKQIITALKDTKYFQKTIFDKYGIKKALLTPLEIIASPLTGNYKLTVMLRPKDLEKAKKYANIDKSIWNYPSSGQSSDKSFEELFEFAKQDALNIISAFDNGLSLEDATQNKSFLTGVEIK